MNLKHSKVIIKLIHALYWWKNNRTFKCIRNLKEKDENFTIKWSIVETANTYTYATRRCDLTLSRKLLIKKADLQKLFTKQSETI